MQAGEFSSQLFGVVAFVNQDVVNLALTDKHFNVQKYFRWGWLHRILKCLWAWCWRMLYLSVKVPSRCSFVSFGSQSRLRLQCLFQIGSQLRIDLFRQSGSSLLKGLTKLLLHPSLLNPFYLLIFSLRLLYWFCGLRFLLRESTNFRVKCTLLLLKFHCLITLLKFTSQLLWSIPA